MSKAKNSHSHTISILVANKPGVLVRCSQVFARRGFNIDALVVSATSDPKFSRMTVTAQGDPESLEQIIKQTAKLVDVITIGEHTGEDAIHRELALVKIKKSVKAKNYIAKISKKYRARIISDQDDAFIIEQSGTSDELDELESELKKFGTIELVRSGKLVITEGKETT